MAITSAGISIEPIILSVGTVVLLSLFVLQVPGIVAGSRKKNISFRLLSLGAVFYACYYIYWRYGFSLNMDALWFALPLVLAENYSILDTIFFALMRWKPAERRSPPPLSEATVDIFITTYNEPAELVKWTVEAANKILWPNKKVYILDDGNRKEVFDLSREYG